MRKWHNNNYLVTGLIFLFNFGFKLTFIDRPSLWYDEIISVQDTLLDFGHIKHEAEWDKNPPFYHYVLWIWCRLFGISVFSVRSMSAFFSALTAVLIYLFTKRITKQHNAFAGAAVFTFHPYLFYYAQEARCYSLLMFLTVLNAICMYSVLQSPSILRGVLLGVINFLIFYTHYIAGLILFCQFLFLIPFLLKKWKLFLAIYLTPIALVLLRFTRKQYQVLFLSQEMSKEKGNVPLSDLNRLLEAISDLFIHPIVFAVMVLMFLFVLINGIRKKQFGEHLHTRFTLFLFGAPLLSILVLFLLGKGTNVFDARYLIFTAPFIVISLCILPDRPKLTLSLAVILVVYSLIQIKPGQSKRMDYKFAAYLAKEIEKKQDVTIIVQTHDVITLFTYYYDRDLFLPKERKSREMLARRDIYYINDVGDLQITPLDGKKPVLLFQTFQKKKDETEIFKYFEDRGYARFTTGQIEGVKFSYLSKPRP